MGDAGEWEWEAGDRTPRRAPQSGLGPGQFPPGEPTPAGQEDCQHLGVLDCGEEGVPLHS